MATEKSITAYVCDRCGFRGDIGPVLATDWRTAWEEANRLFGFASRKTEGPPSPDGHIRWTYIDLCAPCDRRWKFEVFGPPKQTSAPKEMTEQQSRIFEAALAAMN